MLRQLEAECRNHIRCEQQMKLHMEALQEKIDAMLQDQELLQECRSQVQTLSTECESLKHALKEAKDFQAKAESMSAKKNEIIQTLTREKQKLNKKLMLLLESLANLKHRPTKKTESHAQFQTLDITETSD